MTLNTVEEVRQYLSERVGESLGDNVHPLDVFAWIVPSCRWDRELSDILEWARNKAELIVAQDEINQLAQYFGEPIYSFSLETSWECVNRRERELKYALAPTRVYVGIITSDDQRLRPLHQSGCAETQTSLAESALTNIMLGFLVPIENNGARMHLSELSLMHLHVGKG